MPYIMPGFALAKRRPRCSRPIRRSRASILDKHGIFTFGDSAREAYERMIEMVTLAEARLRAGPQGGVRRRARCRSELAAARRGGADPARRLQR